MGSPLELGLGTCLVARRLADELGCTPAEQRRVYWVALLRHIGCTAGSHEFAALVGDEIEFRGGLGGVDFTDQRVLLSYVLRALGGDSPIGRVRALARFVSSAGGDEGGLARGVRGGEPARRRARLRARGPPRHHGGLRALGRQGLPEPDPRRARQRARARRRGRRGGRDLRAARGPRRGPRRRHRARGNAFDPEIAACFAAHAGAILGALDRDDLWADDARRRARDARAARTPRRSSARCARWATSPTSSRPTRPATRAPSPSSRAARRQHAGLDGAMQRLRRSPDWCTTSGASASARSCGARSVRYRDGVGAGAAAPVHDRARARPRRVAARRDRDRRRAPRAPRRQRLPPRHARRASSAVRRACWPPPTCSTR